MKNIRKQYLIIYIKYNPTPTAIYGKIPTGWNCVAAIDTKLDERLSSHFSGCMPKDLLCFLIFIIFYSLVSFEDYLKELRRNIHISWWIWRLLFLQEKKSYLVN